MTDKQIIKALRYCNGGDRENCKALKAEIERLGRFYEKI